MMKHLYLPSADSPAIEWLGFIGFLVLLCLCLGAFVIWLTVGRNGKPKRRRRKHRHHLRTNPTLAQTGGLPPKRDPNVPPPGP